ncbi:MAG: cbiX [Myxococcales bacterium]|nr:cbiX [Myxococcales bacterium]
MSLPLAPPTQSPRSTLGIVVVGHGSREPAANAELEALVARWAASRPSGAAPMHDVTLGYVELARPLVADALVAAGARHDRVVALPLFLFAAGHVKNDLPLALDVARARQPRVRYEAARALGVSPALASLVWTRALAAAPELADAAEAAKTAVVVVGRGASDPDANGDFVKLVRLAGEGRTLAMCEPTFIGITRPLVDDTLDRVARCRPDRIVVVPYFLTAGRLLDKLRGQLDAFAARHPWIRTRLAAHLGADAALFGLMDERVSEATEGARPLECDGCQYRVPLPGRAAEVGGLKALLFSLRHGFTHAQARPHVHAHKAIAKHVLVCANADCADRGSVALIDELRRRIKDAGKKDAIKVTRTSCMGRCGEGPTMVVYPDGIWYRGVAPVDAGEIVQEHLLGDRLVARLVDNIMQ